MDTIREKLSSYKPNIYCWNTSRLSEQFKTYDIEIGHPSIKIAILDSGCDYLHSELNDNILINKSKSMIPYEENIEDYNGHGTAVISSIIGKKNVKGIAPAVSILSYKIVDKNGYGELRWTINAIKLAIQENVHIINISYTSNKIDDIDMIYEYKEVVEEAINKGIYVICAAGNECKEIKQGSENLPIYLAEGIVIASTDYKGELSSFSNYGVGIDFSMPSGGFSQGFPSQYGLVIVAKPRSMARLHLEDQYQVPKDYTLTMGTSISSALFSGTIALLLSRYYRLYKKLPKRNEILSLVKLSGKQINRHYSMVEVNTYRALNEIK
ncbi:MULTISPECIES: S8 family peptidase [Bacillus cereus group]|uniref:S8 family serine peptidase n=4 Tax=Bacillus cereus group TaxID=86661 RepID=A0AAP4Q127_BACTU|nr:MULTISPECIES: S8 family serine peptidase [Bacillus cereus group]AGG04948.1 intracellular serine protease [Bacillus thuringiensis serovar thuringiensis str. IS5056]AJC64495.1 serine protease [Bacillus thuringiensis]ARP61085.1 hypothetical protein CAB88_29015 [Bacillus thuringiensis]EEM31616.1 hypothetical protein bthur0003_58920 [Bacillus thuringiensis serovar thuringiensis str. T01001]EEM62995.1 hypothetical protein bthur0008_53910 [Bacillus thuringiensis serovar berliner ATCC 10792]